MEKIKPKFKVGDVISDKSVANSYSRIIDVTDKSYILADMTKIDIEEQTEYDLIIHLEPFEVELMSVFGDYSKVSGNVSLKAFYLFTKEMALRLKNFDCVVVDIAKKAALTWDNSYAILKAAEKGREIGKQEAEDSLPRWAKTDTDIPNIKKIEWKNGQQNFMLQYKGYEIDIDELFYFLPRIRE